MASAVLPSTNEPYWGERKVYMRKYTNNSSTNKPHFNKFNPSPNPKPNPNPNPNTNPSPSHVPSAQIHDASKAHQWQNHEPPSGAASAAAAFDDQNDRKYLTFDLSKYSRSELKELKRRLRSELDQIRSLRAQIENRAVDYRSQFSGGYGKDIPSVPPRPPPPQLQVDRALQPPEKEKEKRTTPKANQKASGQKRSFPFASGRDPKRHAALDLKTDKLVTSMMKRCEQILGKLMKHKHGWVFNTPVDAVSLGLHDYHQIIKRPMDLGTVKSRLSKKEYRSPLDFASDVRLTFHNAMKYNPKGQDVYIMAETFLKLFEDMFDPAYQKFEADQRRVVAADEVNQRIWAPPKEPLRMVENDNLRRHLPESIEIAKKSDSLRVQEALSNAPQAQVEELSGPVSMPALPSSRPAVIPRLAHKLPKPKAGDPNKRLMSFEEKAKLGLSLQNLPGEKMDQILQIIKRGNSHMAPEGDEIELDIEALDNETLWELDRFVSNHKKAEGKMMRHGLMNNSVLETQINKTAVREATPEAVAQKSRKGGDGGEEDVDIGEDIPVNNFPPVEIEKDTNCGSSRSNSSSSSSSSSDSSSSSGSDSGSSSGSDSEEDSVQSPIVEANGGSVTENQ